MFAVQEVIYKYIQNDGNTEVLEEAKSSFCKRNRMLCRWLFPDIPKRKLNNMVLAAWDSSTETERSVYISKVRYFHNHWKAASLSFHPFLLVPERNDNPFIFENLGCKQSFRLWLRETASRADNTLHSILKYVHIFTYTFIYKNEHDIILWIHVSVQYIIEPLCVQPTKLTVLLIYVYIFLTIL